MTVKSGLTANCPATARNNPNANENRTEVIATFGRLADCLLPISMAAETFAPTARPAERLTNRPTVSALVPTAARAVVSANLPITAESAELNICCSIQLKAIGRANMIILPSSGPFSISMSWLFFVLEALIIVLILNHPGLS